MGQRQVYIKVVAITLVITILFQNFSKILNVAEFVINRSYYAQIECLYRDNPDVMCNAKCVLESILDSDRGDTSTVIESADMSFDKYVVQEISIIEIRDYIPKLDINSVFMDSYYYLFEFHIFKPPISFILI